MTVLEQQAYECLGHAMRQIPALMVEMMKDFGRIANSLEIVADELRRNRVTAKKEK